MKISGFFASAISATALIASGPASAGSVFLTGHDVLLHAGQQGYDVTILDYLRGAGTSTEIVRSAYRIGFISGGVTTPDTRWSTAGFASTTSIANSAMAGQTSASFSAFLGSIDVLVLPWAPALGTTASAAINAFSTEIATFFNAGGDLYANSSINNPTYYDFLPPSAAASGPNLPGNPSSGFVATAAGIAAGITNNMMNGDPTHNTFSSYASAFTVMETYGVNGPVVSIALRDGTISGGGIIPGGGSVPEPSTPLLVGLALAGLGILRKRA